MKLRHLEMALEKLEGYDLPQAALEQYMTPPPLAARLIYHAMLHGDIAERRVCDLGCGTGLLACGAALMGASAVTGVDLDPAALAIARRNAGSAGVHVEFVERRIGADLRDLGVFDTVVMNPPFGAQKRHADRPFIDAALALAPVVWGVFNAGSRAFVTAYIEGKGEVTESVSAQLTLARTFAFHKRERVEIPTEILRIQRTAHG